MEFLTFFVLASVIPSIHPNVFDNVFKIARNAGYDIIDKAGGNTRCSSDLKVLLKDLVRRKLWAVEMLDASAKISSGFLVGNMFMAGNFDECLNIHEEKNDTIIDGQYCTVILQPSSEYPNDVSVLLDTAAVTEHLGLTIDRRTKEVLKLWKVTYGLCIPKSCTIGNLQSLWNYIEHTFRVPVHVAFVDILCRSKDKPIESFPIDKYVIAAFGIYGFILLISTLYDIFVYRNEEDYFFCSLCIWPLVITLTTRLPYFVVNGTHEGNYLTAFSMYSNAKKLFTFPRSPEEGIGLKCISGMKVVSMLWIIFGHRALVNIFSPNINSKFILESWKNIENTPVMAATFAVDTFFVLSGILLSFVYLKNQDLFKKYGMSVGLFYLYRFLRLSPGLLATILFYISIFKRLADGPVWPIISHKLAGSCYKFWWTTFFFGTNLVPVQSQCIEQSWFLAVDTQLYLISPVILKHLVKSPRNTILACVIACLISALYTYIITIQNEYGAVYYEGSTDYYENIYLPTFVRMPAWLIGVIMGYLIFKYQQISIPKFLNLFIWLFSLVTMSFIVLIHIEFVVNSYDPLRSAIFNSSARPAWALSVGLIVFLCISGHGGPINKFLSLPIFQVLVRLTYSMFLVHVGLLLFLGGSRKTPGYFSNINSVHDFIGDIFFTILVATGWCLAFETPFLNISKILIRNGTSDSVAKKSIMYKPSSKKMKKKKNYVVCVYSYEDSKVKNN